MEVKKKCALTFEKVNSFRHMVYNSPIRVQYKTEGQERQENFSAFWAENILDEKNTTRHNPVTSWIIRAFNWTFSWPNLSIILFSFLPFLIPPFPSWSCPHSGKPVAVSDRRIWVFIFHDKVSSRKKKIEYVNESPAEHCCFHCIL